MGMAKFRMSGKGMAASLLPSFPRLPTVLPAARSTVIPAQAGIQNGIAKDRPATNRTFLDSRLRGNDGGDGGYTGHLILGSGSYSNPPMVSQ